MTMGQTCNVCHDREATVRCHQCSKPVCDTCAIKDENGAFCSRTCAAKYREYQETKRTTTAKKGGSFIPKLLGFIIIVAIAVFALYKLGIIKKKDIDKVKQKSAAALKKAADEGKKAVKKVGEK